jgi:hypothetical protein
LQDFVEGAFLDEQNSEISELAHLLTRLERATNYDKSNESGCNGLGLFVIDKELLSKYGK